MADNFILATAQIFSLDIVTQILRIFHLLIIELLIHLKSWSVDFSCYRLFIPPQRGWDERCGELGRFIIFYSQPQNKYLH